jgi:hypothetical protein
MSVTAAAAVTVTVVVEEQEPDKVDGEAGAPDNEDELRVVDHFRREKFLKLGFTYFWSWCVCI